MQPWMVQKEHKFSNIRLCYYRDGIKQEENDSIDEKITFLSVGMQLQFVPIHHNSLKLP